MPTQLFGRIHNPQITFHEDGYRVIRSSRQCILCDLKFGDVSLDYDHIYFSLVYRTFSFNRKRINNSLLIPFTMAMDLERISIEGSWIHHPLSRDRRVPSWLCTHLHKPHDMPSDRPCAAFV